MGPSGCANWWRRLSISHREKAFWVGEVGPSCSEKLLLPLAVRPMPARVCATSRRPREATVKFGGRSSPPMWEGRHRARGPRITKRYTSVLRSMPGHFAFRRKAGVAWRCCCLWSVACGVARHNPRQRLTSLCVLRALQWGQGSHVVMFLRCADGNSNETGLKTP